jgi:hypothetical protein
MPRAQHGSSSVISLHILVFVWGKGRDRFSLRRRGLDCGGAGLREEVEGRFNSFFLLVALGSGPRLTWPFVVSCWVQSHIHSLETFDSQAEGKVGTIGTVLLGSGFA